MKSNAAASIHHRAVFTAAAWIFMSALWGAALAQDIPMFQPQLVNYSQRRMQSECVMAESAGLSTARDNLLQELRADEATCVAPCYFDVRLTQGYAELLGACEEAGGVFYEGHVSITCSVTSNVRYMPECFESACSTDLFEDYIEQYWDFDGCTEIATHTGTTDFSGSPGPDSPTPSGSGSFLAQKSGCGIILALIISLACATWM
jgi:hypothetical protein